MELERYIVEVGETAGISAMTMAIFWFANEVPPGGLIVAGASVWAVGVVVWFRRIIKQKRAAPKGGP